MTTEAREVGLDDYVTILRRRWTTIATATAVVVALALAFTLTREEVYESSADVLILTETTTGLFSFEAAVADQLMRNPRSEIQLAESAPFREAVGTASQPDVDVTLGLVAPPGVDTTEDSSVLRVTARADDPEAARTAAQTFAERYVALRAETDQQTTESTRTRTAELLDRLLAERAVLQAPIAELRTQRLATIDPVERTALDQQIADLESDSQSTIDGLTTQITEIGRSAVLNDRVTASLLDGNSAARVLNAAELQTDPVSPNTTRNLVVALFIGLLLGLVIATLRELFDSSVDTVAEVTRRTGAPLLAKIPQLDRLEGAPGGVTPFRQMPFAHTRSYDNLLDSLTHHGVVDRLGVIAITSDRVGAGTTQTAVNLAHAEARRGIPVCVVDAALTSPGVAARCGVDEVGVGLADLLEGDSNLIDAIAYTDTYGVDVIRTGHVGSASLARLRSDRFADLLSRLAERYHLVVVDLPPLTGLAESGAAASHCDGVVVVFDHPTSQVGEVVDSVEALRSSGAVPIGVVANRA